MYFDFKNLSGVFLHSLEILFEIKYIIKRIFTAIYNRDTKAYKGLIFMFLIWLKLNIRLRKKSMPMILSRACLICVLKQYKSDDSADWAKASASIKNLLCYNKESGRTRKQRRFFMNNNSLAHTNWKCKYYMVFAPKHRKQIIIGR